MAEVQDEQYAEDKQDHAFLSEAEKLLAGENGGEKIES
jgi:hypothetical protein